MPATKKWGKKGGVKPPPGFSYLEPVLEALENELRDKVQESNVGKRNNESIWPVHQINWQRSRYVYNMYYTYKKIDKRTYDFCIRQKIVDANLIAKWKKPGYERLCSTYVINPANYKFGTTSICRVPLKDRDERQLSARDPTTGCMGCASGPDAGPHNIFGNKYGQDLAAIQIAREKRRERKEEEQAAAQTPFSDEDDEDDDEGPQLQHHLNEQDEGTTQKQQQIIENNVRPSEAVAASGEGDSETDDESDDDDDEGPQPQAEPEALNEKEIMPPQQNAPTGGAGDSETDDDDEDDEGPQPATKKAKIS